jgi:hypothetical protein
MSSGTSDLEATPALFDHCVKVYEAMLADATPDESQMIVYEGFLTQLITGKLNLSVPYYTSTRKALVNMGCIRQLRRGGSTTPSQWELIYEPTLEAFMRQQPKRERKPDRHAQQQELIDNLIARVAQLEAQVKSVFEALAEKYGTE